MSWWRFLPRSCWETTYHVEDGKGFIVIKPNFWHRLKGTPVTLVGKWLERDLEKLNKKVEEALK
jgi:hypothetical protein